MKKLGGKYNEWNSSLLLFWLTDNMPSLFVEVKSKILRTALAPLVISTNNDIEVADLTHISTCIDIWLAEILQQICYSGNLSDEATKNKVSPLWARMMYKLSQFISRSNYRHFTALLTELSHNRHIVPVFCSMTWHWENWIPWL